MTSSVSIAMATWNGAQYIREQLASFAAQTRLPDELVITDDGSTDDTLAIVEDFARDAHFDIRVERNSERLGLHRNFERALSLCTGDIVLISDQDDIWYPAKIDTLLAIFAARPDTLAIQHDEHIFDDRGGLLLKGTLGERTRHLGGWDRMQAVGNCTAIRKEILPVVLPLPEHFGYDDWINLVPDLLGARRLLDTPLQLWRRHDDNVSVPSVAEKRPSRWRLYRKFGTADPRPGWARQRQRLILARERISDCSELVDRLLGPGRAASAMRLAAEDIDDIDERIALVSLPKSRRWARALSLWMRGFYRSFSGWRSALKDAVVP
jgi:glycosyltransferase involved in cell wall biosynthesis